MRDKRFGMLSKYTTIKVWLLGVGLLLFQRTYSQQFSLGSLLKLQEKSFADKGKILSANDFNLQTSNNNCQRYTRTQADAFSEVYDETATICSDGGLTYSTYSPNHATDIAFQLTRKYGFTDKGAATTTSGRMTNVYQKNNLKVESILARDASQVNFWVFHFSPTNNVVTPPLPPNAQVARGTEIKNDTPNDPIASSTNHALLIGVNSYEAPIEDLRFPIDDTQRFKKVLTTHYTFEEKNVVSLANPTGDDIINALNDLIQKLSVNDNLLLFYAGHGREDKAAEQGYWLPADAKYNTIRSKTWLSNSDIKDQLKLLRCRHVLVISDACFSGGILDARSGPESVAFREIARRKSRKAITSTASTIVPDKSVFTKYLLQYLETNTSPYLTAAQLFSLLQVPVTDNSPTKQSPQYGSIREAGNEGGDFIFVRKKNK
ncbi:MAG: caspase family protein [Runella slithyformis]|nr:MAG: caspase family protein [Runella slithyformis]